MEENQGTIVSSQSLGKLAEALSKAQSKYLTLKKSKTATIRMKSGGEYTYKYADLSDLIDATRPSLCENGLAVTQLISDDKLTTMLIHSSGECIKGTTNIPKGLTPQEFGSALTYYRRYAMGSILGIAGEEDDDGKGAQNGTGKDKKPSPEKDAPITDAQKKRLFAIAKSNGWNDNEVMKATMKSFFNIESTKDIMKSQYDDVVSYFEKNRGNG